MGGGLHTQGYEYEEAETIQAIQEDACHCL